MKSTATPSNSPDAVPLKSIVTLSHSPDGTPLHRVRHRAVLFANRFDYKAEGYSYHSGFLGEDGIHYATIIRIEPVQPGDENHPESNAVVEEVYCE